MTGQGSHKILVVDDEPDVERLVRQRMRREIRDGRYTFLFASHGLEALDRLREDQSIDMVLSDINMPQMDGITLLAQIPSVAPDVRSVVISAYGDMENIRRAMNRGAFDFITKPIDFDDLRLTIDRALRQLMLWREAQDSRDRLLVLENELVLAGQMQQSILPAVFPEDPRYQIFARMVPARNVGGDFFDIVRLAEGRIGLSVADVSDKGVAAALFMMTCRTLLKGAALSHTNPANVLREVNSLLHEHNESMMFVTMMYGVFDPANGEFVYANGGHNPALVARADGGSSLLPLVDGLALGVVSDFEYRERIVVVSPGDTVVLYTDGVTEAENEKLEQFGISRLREVLTIAPASNARDATTAIFEAIRAFVGETSQSDDITCLTLHRSGFKG